MVLRTTPRVSSKVDTWFTCVISNYCVYLCVILLQPPLIRDANIGKVLHDWQKAKCILAGVTLSKLADGGLRAKSASTNMALESRPLARLDEHDLHPRHELSHASQLLHVPEARHDERAVELIPVSPDYLAGNDVVAELIERSHGKLEAFLIVAR